MRDPGEMNRRVTITTAGRPTSDGMGGFVPGEPTELETWAKVEPLEGDEQLQAMQIGMKRPHRFTMRYRTDLTAAQDLVYGGRSFDVKSVTDPGESRQYLVVLADEVFD